MHTVINNTSIAENKMQFEHHLNKWCETFNTQSMLDKAICYAMQQKAKRIRPLLIILFSNAFHSKIPLNAALSVECLHTASLIADDLPCMDDADLRRGVKSVHKKFGQDVAILATYKLIGHAFELIIKETKEFALDANLTQFIIHQVANNCILTADGQMCDLYPDEKSTINLKTGSLFEMAFLHGWIFATKSLKEIDIVKKAAFHFGLAFQMQDDFSDIKEDIENNHPNMALKMGAKQSLENHIHNFCHCLETLGCLSNDFLALVEFLQAPLHNKIV